MIMVHVNLRGCSHGKSAGDLFEISVPLRSKVKNLVCEQGELSRQVSFPFPCQTHKSIQVIGMFFTDPSMIVFVWYIDFLGIEIYQSHGSYGIG